MMTVLLESAGGSKRRGSGWTAASVMIHGTIMAAAILATTRAAQSAFEPPVVERIKFVEPLPVPVRPRPTMPIIGEIRPTIALPVVDLPVVPTLSFAATSLPPIDGPVVSGTPSWLGATTVTAPGEVHDPHEVERVVRIRAGNGSPAYPRPLRAVSIEGDVLVRFVVDTLGRVEPGSVSIVQSTHDLFSAAVRDWITRTRYEPASIGRTRVRQLVQQRVGFTLDR
jgi:TonB family protein